MVGQTDAQLVVGFLCPQLCIGRFQRHQVLHVVDGLLVATAVHGQLGTQAQIGYDRLGIGFGERADGTVEQGQGSLVLIQLYLTLGGSIEVLGITQGSLLQLFVDGVCVGIFHHGIEQLSLLQAVDRLGVDAIGLLRLLKCTLQRPAVVRLVGLVDDFLVDKLGILVVRIVRGVADLDGLLHVLLGSCKLPLVNMDSGTIDVAVGHLREFGDEALYQLF